jgi:hypothetical protein
LNSGFVPIIPTISSTRSNPVFAAEQNFFPSFFRNAHLPARPFSNRHLTNSAEKYLSKTAFDESILGSGDFAIMKGGTFYGDGEKQRPNHEYFGSGTSFFDTQDNGRPFALPQTQPQTSDENRFANFKDFADITAGIDTDFSHLVAVYALKNNSITRHEPKNILEQLQMIDDEQADVLTEKQTKRTKLSKVKTKLLSTKLVKERKANEAISKNIFKNLKASSLENTDPLIAES